MAIHEELASDYIRSTFEFCLPKVVRENDYGIRVGRTMVFAGQDASCNRTDAEYLKIIAGHHLCGHRLSVAERGDADRREGTAKDPLESCFCWSRARQIGYDLRFQLPNPAAT